MVFDNLDAAVKVIKTLLYMVLALVLVIVFLGFTLYVRGDTIDKLNLSLTAKESAIYACNSQKVTLTSALDTQTKEVEKNKIDLKKAKEDLATRVPVIIKMYKRPPLDANATCEAQLNGIKQTMEVYHANR